MDELPEKELREIGGYYGICWLEIRSIRKQYLRQTVFYRDGEEGPIPEILEINQIEVSKEEMLAIVFRSNFEKPKYNPQFEFCWKNLTIELKGWGDGNFNPPGSEDLKKAIKGVEDFLSQTKGAIIPPRPEAVQRLMKGGEN